MHGSFHDWNQPRPHRVPDSKKTRLMGEPVTSAQSIERCYQRGRFYYQFVRPGYLSRIMRCDNDSECKWLSQQVDPRNPVMIRPM